MDASGIILGITGLIVLIWLAVSRNKKKSENNRFNSTTKNNWYE